MARRKNFRKGKGGKAKNQQQNWDELVKHNQKWELYYKNLNLFENNTTAWDTFKAVCQSPLPLTFRITSSRAHSDEVLKLFKENHLPNLTNVEFEGEAIKPPTQLPWYPGQLAWQLDVPKTVIRKNEQFAKTQRFLVIENDVGNISRQEAVSMIPPIVLEVEPHHTVLDMCAAPGSKTAQMIEALHKGTDEPTGFIIANDADNKRSHMLVHQLKRLNTANLMVVNHDAQFFPRLKLFKDATKKKDFVKFDRILCDVPCSGDGTMRKNIQVWKNWNTQNALGLHTVQLNILERGLNLLKPTGRLVYSTCSMNPIENEAVVAAALRKWGGKVRLVNCKDKLPGLIRSKGITNWPVLDRDMEPMTKGAEKVNDSWFPPSEEEIKNFNLDYCLRVYPQQQNTGGFFITVLEKIENDDDQTEEREVKKQCVEKPVTKDSKSFINKEEPVVFISPENEVMRQCVEFYGIDDSFDMSTSLVRNQSGEPSKSIYSVCPSLKSIIQANDDKLKIVYTGTKLFVCQRSDVECSWKIQGEALPMMRHHISAKRVIRCSLELLKYLLETPLPTIDTIRESKVDDKFLNQVQSLNSGCVFIDVKRGNDESLMLPIWKGIKSINLMVRKEDSYELLYRLFGVETQPKKPKNPSPEVETKEED